MSEPLESALERMLSSGVSPTQLGTEESDKLLAYVQKLRARPTREQALRAMDCWIGDNYRLGTHNSPEDCLDAAMREQP